MTVSICRGKFLFSLFITLMLCSFFIKVTCSESANSSGDGKSSKEGENSNKNEENEFEDEDFDDTYKVVNKISIKYPHRNLEEESTGREYPPAESDEEKELEDVQPANQGILGAVVMGH
ncbi:hypothetical protein JCGZ_13775 [Jatropha curcas]|uniref:Uncharacterized protein n=1 Tax=Jatropha curcas TaxID=180498 RepID=A0A067K3Z0_JATCU|nr:hypothetical protein JCGZ_13775 [Jatropha curcas]